MYKVIVIALLLFIYVLVYDIHSIVSDSNTVLRNEPAQYKTAIDIAYCVERETTEEYIDCLEGALE